MQIWWHHHCRRVVDLKLPIIGHFSPLHHTGSFDFPSSSMQGSEFCKMNVNDVFSSIG